MDDVSFARLEWEARSVDSLSECTARINDSVSSDAYLYLEIKYESHFTRTALSATAVVASVLYALACAWAMYKQRVSRRFYTLIFNRVGADLLISTNQLLIDLVRLIGYCGQDCIIYVIFNPFVMLFLMLYGLLTTAVSYIALLLIKLYAVARPMDARGGVHLRTCVLIVVASWSIPLLGIIIAEVVLRTNSSTHFYSTVMKYANALESTIPFLLVGSYLNVLFIYAFTVFYVWRSRRAAMVLGAERSESARIKHKLRTRYRFRVPLLRVSANIANFALLEFPIAAYFLLRALYGDNRSTKLLLCTGMRSSHAIYLLHTAIWPALMARIIIDVVIGFVTDPKIRIWKRPSKANSSDQIPASPQVTPLNSS